MGGLNVRVYSLTNPNSGFFFLAKVYVRAVYDGACNPPSQPRRVKNWAMLDSVRTFGSSSSPKGNGRRGLIHSHAGRPVPVRQCK